MDNIGLYTQVTSFSTQHAGTAEWCVAERSGKKYFVKKFHNPVYPSKEIGLPEKMYAAGVDEFHRTLNGKKELYRRLRESDKSGTLVIPVEVINYQFHVCTIAEYVKSNVMPEEICRLSEWQRLLLMRTLTLALMNVHKAGVVHSDMKPDNVLVTQGENGHCRLRLIDFDGSFLESAPPDDPEDVVGDPAFFAPEAYQMSVDEDIRLDCRIDVFALGLVFHYFWTGKHPERPAGEMIGETVLKGGRVILDPSIPPVLRQLITRMIQADPAARLSLKSVYDVLGIQISQRKPEIINLQEGKPKDTAAGSAAGTGAKRKADAEKTVEKKAEVRINCCDERGKVLNYRTLRIPYGSSEIITAEEIPGYRLASMKTKEITVRESGYVESPVTFTYREEGAAGPAKPEEPAHKGKKALKVLLILLVVYLIIVYILSESSKANNDFEAAHNYQSALPFYSTLFREDYKKTLEAADQSRYSRAVSLYRSKAYGRADEIFLTFPETYQIAGKYHIFCRAHIYGAEDYYDTIIDNLDFEDAKDILTQDSSIFCRYLQGTWTYKEKSSTEQLDAVLKDGGYYTLYNLPELPGGGCYTIKDGVLRYQYDGKGEWVDYFLLSIASWNKCKFYSYQSGTNYSLTRK